MRPASALGLVFVLAVASWEATLALRAPLQVATDADWQGAEGAVRAAFAPGDLIVFAPPWVDSMGRRFLGDLMPAAMVGRPDSARYGRIWELSLRGARAPEVAELLLEERAVHGRVTLSRYRQRPVTVTQDLVDAYLLAKISQVPLAGKGEEQPCLWAGPLPTQSPPRGEAGAFHCRASRIERRVMEIGYRPRYGIVVPAEDGLRTVLEYEVPAAAFAGAKLWLWAGLHDYYARKTDSGPVDVVVDLDRGQRRATLSVPRAGWHRLIVDAPAPAPGQAAHVVRIEISARDARARNLGLAVEVRR